MAEQTAVGIIANPASSRDSRRLVADGAVVTTHDKVTTLRRVLAGLAGVDVDRVISMTDASGISGGLLRAAQATSATHWPPIEFVDVPLRLGPDDTRHAVRQMVAAGVGAIVVLGGDGTAAVVAEDAGTVPLLPLSTGTNNAFPSFTEPTVAGMAAGLVAGRAVPVGSVTHRAKALHVTIAGTHRTGLVDVAVIADDRLGTGTVDVADPVRELYLCFAEPGAIGMSAVGAAVQPTCRTAPHGLALHLGSPAGVSVMAPVAPGRIAWTTVGHVTPLEAGATVEVQLDAGVIAIDGERTARFDSRARPRIELRRDGPVVIDPRRVLDRAAAAGLFSAAERTTTPSRAAPPTSRPTSHTRPPTEYATPSLQEG